MCGAGACVGAGVDIVTACDIRYCTADALFCVKEADLAIVADMGTLQRLPGIVGQGDLYPRPYGALMARVAYAWVW